VHGVILTGAGDKAFIAGADISELRMSDAYTRRSPAGWAKCAGPHRNLGKPVIAAINGFALAAAARRAMHAPSGSQWSTPVRAARSEAGLLPGGGGTQRLPRLVGKGRALQLILTGETISRARSLSHRPRQRSRLRRQSDRSRRDDSEQIMANAPIAVKFSWRRRTRG